MWNNIFEVFPVSTITTKLVGSTLVVMKFLFVPIVRLTELMCAD